MATPENPSLGAPVRVLGLFDSICIIVGIIVGTGIFMTPMAVAAMIPSAWRILFAWVLGGALCVAGGLCYAELAATYPAAGGEYVYFCRAFGPWAGFLFSWSKMLVIRTGSIGAMAYAFGTYAEQILYLGSRSIPLYAGLAILVLTGLNILGIRVGSLGQNILTVAKVCGILGVLLVALISSSSPIIAEIPNTSTTLPNFMVAMILILWTYGGWNETAYVAAEVRHPEKSLPRSIFYGTVFVIILYTAINAVFLRTLGVAGVAGSKAVAADCLATALGEPGRQIISALVLLSALGAVNGLILTGARISYAMGVERSLFRLLGQWSSRFGGPIWAFLVQGFLSVILVWTGTFEALVTYTAAAAWIFFALVPLSLLILRWRDPDTPRIYRVPLYPFVPILFLLCCLYMLYSSVTYAGIGALLGFLIVLSGLPVYWVSRWVERGG